MINEDNQEEVVDDLPEVGEGEEDTTDYKSLASKYQGMAKRFQTRVKKLAEKPPVKAEEKKLEPEKEKKKEVLDRIDRAVLTVRGITEPEEIEMVEKAKTESGKTVEELLNSTWFQSELKEFRENLTSFEAIPKGSKRSNQSSRDSVDYWIKKGTLPPSNQVELRRKVVNAKMKKEKAGNIFTETPVV